MGRQAVRIVVLCAVASGIFGCNEHVTITDAHPPFGLSVVTGIRMTNESGDIIGDWGEPSGGGVLAYPNPCSLWCSFTFRVEESAHVTVWIEPALGPGETAPDLDFLGVTGAAVMVPGEIPIIKLWDRDYSGPYTLRLIWRCEDSSHQPVEAGYYRVYFMSRELHWVDVLVARTCSEIPPAIQWVRGCP
jgi:hypothetical protein